MMITTDPQEFLKESALPTTSEYLMNRGVLQGCPVDGITLSRLGKTRRPRKSEFGLKTIKQAADALHSEVTVSAIRQAIRDGRLKATRIGKRDFVTEEALKEFVSCPDQKNQPDSGSAATMGRGSSSTKDAKSGLASVTDFVNRQKIS